MAWAVDNIWKCTGVRGQLCGPYQDHKYTDKLFHSEMGLLPLQLPYTHCLHFHIPREHPSFSCSYGKDHQLKCSAPVTTLDSSANVSSNLFFPIPALCASRGPTQTYFNAGTSRAQTEGNCGFSYQIRNIWLSAVSQLKECLAQIQFELVCTKNTRARQMHRNVYGV